MFFEYRLWQNHGQVIFDYSLNNRHASNGYFPYQDNMDCLYSDRGLYFSHHLSHLKSPPNTLKIQQENLNPPYSVLMWINEIELGRYFFRWSPSMTIVFGTVSEKTYFIQYIGNNIENIYSKFENLDNVKWNFFAMTVLDRTIIPYLNNQEMLSSSLSLDYSENLSILTGGFGSDNGDYPSFIGFLWYAAVLSGENIQDFIFTGTSNNCLSIGSCSCSPAFKLDSIIGCITSDTDLTRNSNQQTCQYSKCNGGLLNDCTCNSLSCFFDIKTECECLSSLPDVVDTCICPDGESCCNNGCSKCKYSDLCTSCNDPNAEVGLKSLCYCKKGFFGKSPLGKTDSCSPCSEECSTCTELEVCTECKDSKKISIEGQCKCSKGYFLNSSNLCDSCHPDCLECVNKTSCIECKSKNSEIDEVGCRCKQGYWKKLINENYECVKCLNECESCEKYDSCLKCKDKMQLNKQGQCECGIGYYKDDGKCKECAYNCIYCNISIFESNKTQCNKCMTGYANFDGECKCPSGFQEANKTCIQQTFSLIISIDLANDIYLIFTKDVDLNEKSYTIETSLTSFDTKLEKISNSSYILQFKFSQSVKSNTSLSIVFENPTLSQTYETLDKLIYNMSLYEFEFISPLLQKIIKNVQQTTKYSHPITIFLSIFTDPSSSWLLISSLQLISFIPISRNPLPPASTKYCKAISQYNFIPNLPEMIFNPNSSSIPFVQARKIGIESSNVLINIGSEITLLMATLVLWPVVFLFLKLNVEELNECLDKILKNYKFSVFIRFWIQNHMIFGLYSLLNFESIVHNQDLEGNFCHIISVCLIVIFKKSGFLITPAIIFITLWIDHDKLKNQEDQEYLKKYGSLFAEFYYDKQLIHVQYYFVSTSRNVMFVLSQLYLSDYKFLQKILNIFANFTLLGYIILWRVFTEKIILVSNIVAEATNCLVFLLILGKEFIEGLRTDENFDYGFMGIISFQIMFQFTISVILLIASIRERYLNYKNNV